MEELKLTEGYLQKAIEKVGPSLDEEDRQKYTKMAERVNSKIEA